MQSKMKMGVAAPALMAPLAAYADEKPPIKIGVLEGPSGEFIMATIRKTHAIEWPLTKSMAMAELPGGLSNWLHLRVTRSRRPTARLCIPQQPL